MAKTNAQKAQEKEDLKFAYEYLHEVMGTRPGDLPEEGSRLVYVVSTSAKPPVHRMKLLVTSEDHGIINITLFVARVLSLRYGSMGDLAMSAMGTNAHAYAVYLLSQSLYGVANRGGYCLAHASL